MKEVIVTRGFNNLEVIGSLRLVDGVEVPIGSVFALGGIVRKSHKDRSGKEVVDEFELVEVSLIPDSQFIAYKAYKEL
jgi:hypothetical protein